MSVLNGLAVLGVVLWKIFITINQIYHDPPPLGDLLHIQGPIGLFEAFDRKRLGWD
ncbi:hypothetical protein EV426DRAFT_568790 [Tirmania nivea]|nr:hypothetical protein EV426DRAFT_568790 [Tirmania nivea]